MNLARRLQKLEEQQRLTDELKVLRMVVASLGGSEDEEPTCSRTRCANGMIMELIDLGSSPEVPEGEALERWIAGFPIEQASGFHAPSARGGT